jgi:hypothetical protein
LKECERARLKLQEAYAVHQNDYAILLNLGLVYADPRCDPENQYMQFSREFLTQSVQIKPSDYYGHQQLARLGIRETYTWGPDLTTAELVNDAVKSAEQARRLRPNDGTIFALLAQTYILQWAKSTDAAQRKELEPKIEASITQAEKYKATPVHLATVRAQWLLQQVRFAEGDQLKELKSQLVAELDKASEVAKDEHSWYGRQLQRDATKLKKVISGLVDAKRERLNWPN